MTFNHIPMIIGTLMEGLLGVGCVLGAMFGLSESMYSAFTRPVTIRRCSAYLGSARFDRADNLLCV